MASATRDPAQDQDGEADSLSTPTPVPCAHDREAHCDPDRPGDCSGHHRGVNPHVKSVSACGTTLSPSINGFAYGLNRGSAGRTGGALNPGPGLR